MPARPTPRDGWTAVPAPRKERSSSPSVIFRPPGPSTDATHSFAELKPPTEIARAATRAQKTLMGLPTPNLAQELARRPKPQEESARRPGRKPNMDVTEEVSLADVSLASLSPVGSAAAAAERTEDISLQYLSLAPAEVANDVTSHALHGAASDPSLSAPDLARSGRSKRWLWAVATLGLLAGAALVALESRAGHDPRKRDDALVGGVLPAHRTAATVATQPPAPSEPERPLPATLAETPLLPPAAPEGDSNATLQAAQASAAAADTTPKDEATDQLGTTPNDEGSEEVDAEDHGALDAARHAALTRADGLVSQASALRKRKKLAPARSKYRAALAVYPDHPRALYCLAQIAIQQHNGKQAVQLALNLVQAKPDQVSYLVLLGDAYKAAGKPKDAREAWQSAARQGSAVARKRLK